MGPSPNDNRIARFGLFEADLGRQQLYRRGLLVHLQEKPFQLLTLLLTRAGQVVTRDELRQQLWGTDTFVEFDDSVNAAVGKLRYALGDSAESPTFIETVRGRGYRWLPPIEWTETDRRGSSSEKPPVQDVQPPGSRETQPVPSHNAFRHKTPILAAAAGLILIAVGVAMRPTRPKPSPVLELQQRQVTVNPTENPVFAAAISPDGKYLAYLDLSGLHLKLLDTGEVRDIAEPASLQGKDMYWGLGFWSPDSSKVLAIANFAGSRYEAWELSTLGSAPIKLRDDAVPLVFSPDGTQIVFVRNLGALGFREAWVMDAKGDHARKLFEVDGDSEIWGVQWSPEGKFLGYLKVSQRGTEPETSLEALDFSTGASHRVLANQDIRDFLWLPHGRIVYTAGRTDIHGLSCNYWDLGVNPDTGEVRDQPRPLTQWAGFCMVNTTATSDGKRLAFQREAKQLDVYVAGLSQHSLKISEPQPLTREEGMNFPTGWTQEGAVVFGSNRTGQWGIFRQGIHESQATPIFLGLETVSQETPVSPDGAWVLNVSYPKSSPWFLNLLYPSETGFSPPGYLSRIPVSGGPAEKVLDNILGARCTSSAAGFCVALEKTQDGKALLFRVVDPSKGWGKTLARFDTEDAKVNYDWDLSPDGSAIAVFKIMGDSFYVISTDTGQTQSIEMPGRQGLRSVKWSSDARGFFVVSAPKAALEVDATLLYVDRQGKATPLWVHKGVSLNLNVLPSPDGRYLAFPIYATNSNVWIVENF